MKWLRIHIGSSWKLVTYKSSERSRERRKYFDSETAVVALFNWATTKPTTVVRDHVIPPLTATANIFKRQSLFQDPTGKIKFKKEKRKKIMSWLARSIANSLRIDEDEEENDVAPNEAKFDPSPTYCHQISPDDDEHQQTPSTPPDLENDEPQTRGVKEDLNELTQTLSRQLWGVASFLVPPPDSNAHLIESGPLDRDDEDDHVNPAIGVSDMDGDRDRIAYGSEEEEEEDVELYAVGITDEVLAFATNIAHHPETWLDFPMDEEEDLDGICYFFAYLIYFNCHCYCFYCFSSLIVHWLYIMLCFEMSMNS